MDTQSRWLMLPKGGYSYGVEAGHNDGTTVELHGGFRTYAKAAQVRDRLLRDYTDYEYAKVVKIETPEVDGAPAPKPKSFNYDDTTVQDG
jgi:hypothetical protein